jgi:hypothetical protein
LEAIKMAKSNNEICKNNFKNKNEATIRKYEEPLKADKQTG